MVTKIDTALVTLWGETVGAVSWLDDREYAIFEFDPAFIKKGLDLSPIHMPLAEARQGDGIFSFPGLNKDAFLGLPGLLADALPDKFGNAIIDAWLARNGRSPASFSPVQRLCYTGRRGMGALEFSPPVNRNFDKSVPVEISELVGFAQDVMAQRSALDVTLGAEETMNAEAMQDILRVGTSAGGARPKAVVAISDDGRVISGQAPDVPAGFEYYLLKFDGVSDLELGEPQGYGRIEYAYYLMAREAGITMTDCRLFEENGRAHFLTRRFDRLNSRKIHLQSLCGLAHFDFNHAGAYSYEQAFSVMRQLRLSKADAVQQYRRMLFNVIARNQDDHTKNISFLMDPSGKWHLSPAFDVTFSHNPAGKWTNLHQMTINGKRDHFTSNDLISVGESISIPQPRKIIEEIIDAVAQWPNFAHTAGLAQQKIETIGRFHLRELH